MPNNRAAALALGLAVSLPLGAAAQPYRVMDPSLRASLREQPPPDARAVAEAYLAARMIYTTLPDTTPDGKAAEVRAIVAGKPCTISLVRDAAGYPWRVTASACPDSAN